MLEPVRFIVLIPHRDCGRLIRFYQDRLFAAGIIGAYSFPIAAPLAVVSQPFAKEELKMLARFLRAASAAPGRDGKITAGALDVLSCPPDILSPSLFGLELDLPIPDIPRDLVRYQFPSMLLCAGLIPKEDLSLLPQERFPIAPQCFFRAALVANLILRPLSSGAKGYSFEWKIGVPVWLPGYRKSNNRLIRSEL